jgi:hypothetical protein
LRSLYNVRNKADSLKGRPIPDMRYIGPNLANAG